MAMSQKSKANITGKPFFMSPHHDSTDSDDNGHSTGGILSDLHGLFEPDVPARNSAWSILSILVNTLIFLAIVVFIFSALISTMPQFYGPKFQSIFDRIDFTCGAIFTVEIVLRFISTPRWVLFFSKPFNIIDTLVLIFFYIEQIMKVAPVDAATLSWIAVVRVLRLLKIFRTYRLARFSMELDILHGSVMQSFDALSLMLFMLSLTVILSSTLMYYAEQNETHSSDYFRSIPATFWWCVQSLTTVGYGDAVPNTWIGRGVAMVTMMVGVLLVAFPTILIGSRFEHFDRMWRLSEALKLQIITESPDVGSLPEFSASAWKFPNFLASAAEDPRNHRPLELGLVLHHRSHIAHRACGVPAAVRIPPLKEGENRVRKLDDVFRSTRDMFTEYAAMIKSVQEDADLVSRVLSLLQFEIAPGSYEHATRDLKYMPRQSDPSGLGSDVGVLPLLSSFANIGPPHLANSRGSPRKNQNLIVPIAKIASPQTTKRGRLSASPLPSPRHFQAFHFGEGVPDPSVRLGGAVNRLVASTGLLHTGQIDSSNTERSHTAIQRASSSFARDLAGSFPGIMGYLDLSCFISPVSPLPESIVPSPSSPTSSSPRCLNASQAAPAPSAADTDDMCIKDAVGGSSRLESALIVNDAVECTSLPSEPGTLQALPQTIERADLLSRSPVRNELPPQPTDKASDRWNQWMQSTFVVPEPVLLSSPHHSDSDPRSLSLVATAPVLSTEEMQSQVVAFVSSIAPPESSHARGSHSGDGQICDNGDRDPIFVARSSHRYSPVEDLRLSPGQFPSPVTAFSAMLGDMRSGRMKFASTSDMIDSISQALQDESKSSDTESASNGSRSRSYSIDSMSSKGSQIDRLISQRLATFKSSSPLREADSLGPVARSSAARVSHASPGGVYLHSPSPPPAVQPPPQDAVLDIVHTVQYVEVLSREIEQSLRNLRWASSS